MFSFLSFYKTLLNLVHLVSSISLQSLICVYCLQAFLEQILCDYHHRKNIKTLFLNDKQERSRISHSFRKVSRTLTCVALRAG